MKFAIDAIVLFSRHGQKRRISFSRNGVNVITGESGTGKTAILDIFDYCFLASKHKISDSVINENVSWYGIEFYADGREVVLARRAPNGNRVSPEYFFSEGLDEDWNPKPNISEDDLRNVLEGIFKIDSRTVVPYGGRTIKAGSRFSFRYFFLFNTISQDIITNSEVFFDKQNEDRYREALPRIFDLALGIDDLANISAREKRDELQKELNKLQRKVEHIKGREQLFEQETKAIARRAIEYGLIDGKVENPSAADIRQIVDEAYKAPDAGWTQRYNQLSSQIYLLNKRIRMLERFSQETQSYRSTLSSVEDSLLPMARILERSDELVKTDAFDDLISGLKADLQAVKEEIARKKPIDRQVSDLVKKLKQEKAELTLQLEGVPPTPVALQSEREKWLFIGETRGKLDTFSTSPVAFQVPTRSASDIDNEIGQIQVRDVDAERHNVLRAIEDVALELKDEIKAVLENYADYIPVFNLKDKRLEMRKPRSALIENVGSSSNHMFMHLLHFLALHEVAISMKSPFVPTLLLIDQPSRPYYGDEEQASKQESLPKTDTGKITAAFQLLNDFVAHVNMHYQQDFQMIVFEHVPVSIFATMPNVHLVEKFRNGVALIPRDWTGRT